MPTPSTLDKKPPAADVSVREAILNYVLAHSHTTDAEHIRQLYEHWQHWNGEHFEGRMVVPIILLSEPAETKSYGDTSPASGFGCTSQIRLRPAILDGTLHALRNGNQDREGLQRFLTDVLLHEMVHQWHFEITGQPETSYSGHGPHFSGTANKIGATLGLPAVRRTCKSRDGTEPSPSQWPHDVRPPDYYRGAHAPNVHTRQDTAQQCPHCNGTGRVPHPSGTK